MASAQRLIADIATHFPLPTASEALRQRHVALKTASKELQRLEIEYAEVTESNASTTAACQLLAERLQFLTTLAQSIKTNNWNTAKAKYRLSAVKSKVKDEITELEARLEAQKAVIERLQTSIEAEKMVLVEHRKKDSEFTETSTRAQEHLATLDDQAKKLRDAYTADERVVQVGCNFC
uniref:RING-type E3 ubiquitin transferase n=1 Tax=Panagrellus redivivus TaxID=6233 RepID=A0A7E4VN46_PANRE